MMMLVVLVVLYKMKNFSESINYKVDSSNLPWSCEFFLPEYFNRIEKKVGIYSWHLIPSNYVSEEAIFKYMEVFTDNSIDLLGKTNFSTYSGNLQHENMNDIDKVKAVINNDISRKNLIIATSIFSPALYIGISKNLNSRINQHFKIITDIYNKISVEDFYSKLDETEQDAAKNFGERITDFFKKNDPQNYSLSDFCVKIFYMDSIKDTERDKLEGIEYILNRTYKPKFGKI